MFGDQIVYRVHAIRRMFERAISEANVRETLTSGETIEDYPAEAPYPSRLMFGRTGGFPLHVVAA
jgi:hypothetical protein